MRKLHILICLFIIFLIVGCSKSEDSMTELDKEYDKYAKNAAEKFIKNEAEIRTWTNVQVGELVYEYTVYNQELDKYIVVYMAKFDEDDKPEDQWIEINVALTGKAKYVENVEGVYYDATSYEMYTIPRGIEDKDGYWNNINYPE